MNESLLCDNKQYTEVPRQKIILLTIYNNLYINMAVWLTFYIPLYNYVHINSNKVLCIVLSKTKAYHRFHIFEVMWNIMFHKMAAILIVVDHHHSVLFKIEACDFSQTFRIVWNIN